METILGLTMEAQTLLLEMIRDASQASKDAVTAVQASQTTANEALTRIESHEKVCADRWDKVHSTMKMLLGTIFTGGLGFVLWAIKQGMA